MSDRSISISGGQFGGPVVFGDVAGSVVSAGSHPEEAPRSERTTAGSQICLHLGIDLVGYRQWRGVQQSIVQKRLARLIEGLQLEVSPQDALGVQATGDGANLIFPASFDLRPGVRRILTYFARGLAEDRARYGDPMVLRLGFEVGPTSATALGQDGMSIIALSEMLNSQPLREAAGGDEVSAAFGLSPNVHLYVVEEGYLDEWENDIALKEFTRKDGRRSEVWIGVVRQGRQGWVGGVR